MDRILLRKNSAPVSLALSSTRRSLNEKPKPSPPRAQRASYSRSCSSADSARAGWSLTGTTKPIRDSRAWRRNSRYSAFTPFFVVRVERAVMRWDAVIRGALEHVKVSCLLGDDRDCLDRRRSRADHRNTLAGEIDTFMRPAPGVVPAPLEDFEAGEGGEIPG